MHKRGKRVLGPYKDRKGFRVVVIEAGQRRSFVYEARRTAEKAARLFKREIEKEESLTIGDAKDEFLGHLVKKECRPNTIRNAKREIERLFPEQETLLVSLTKQQCAACYEALLGEFSVATHRQSLTTNKGFLNWCVARGFLEENPLLSVKGVGRKRRGKLQLRIDEARRFYDHCFLLAEEGEDGGLACLMALLMGMRTSEILDRTVRDVDDECSILWVEDGKTDAARRQLLIPPPMRPLFRERIEGKPYDAPIFKRRYGRYWPLRWTRKICEAASVPVVTTHSLRGLHATLATAQGATSLAVSQALGHASQETAEAHYTQAVAIRGAKQARVLEVIEGGKADAPFRNCSAREGNGST